MRGRGSMLALALLGAACLDPQPVPLPVGRGGATALFLLRGGALAEAWIQPSEDGRPVARTFLEARDEQASAEDVWWVELDAALDELTLDPGAVDLRLATRALPSAPRQVLHFDRRQGAFRDEGAPAAALYASFRLPPFDFAGCVDGGGCLKPDTTDPICQGACAGAPPDPAALPALTTPAGWLVDPTLSGRLPVARPVVPPALTCELGAYQAPYATACAPLSVACDPSGWPNGTFEVYVHPAAPAGGDGTRARPYRTLDEAFGGSAVGASVALAVGRHPAPSSFPSAVTLSGACGETVLSGPLLVDDGELIFRDLVIDGPGPTLTVRGGHAQLERGVIIPTARDQTWAVVVEGGTFTASVAKVVDFLGGLRVDNGAVDLHRVEVRTTGGDGIRIRRGQAALEDVALRAAPMPESWGLVIEPPGAMVAQRIVVEGYGRGGIHTEGPLELTDAVIRGSVGRVEETGVGVSVYGTGRAVLHRVEASGNTREGFLVTAGATLEATALRVIGNGRAGSNGSVVVDAFCTLRDAVFAENQGDQLYVATSTMPEQSAAPVDLADVHLVVSGPAGPALSLNGEGRTVVTRLSCQGGGEACVVLRSENRLEASDVTLWPTNVGIRAADGSDLKLRRVLIDGGVRPLVLSSADNLRVAENQLVDLEVRGDATTMEGIFVGRANLHLLRYRLLGAGQGVALRTFLPPGRLTLGTAYGEVSARMGEVEGWARGFTLAAEAQAQSALGQVVVRNTPISVEIVPP